ncbi:hypothetical protein [Nocardioides pacificus]
MTESTPESRTETPSEAPSEAPGETPPESTPPSWWHRDHPTFTPVAGFFSGLLFVIFVPGAFATILRLFFPYDTARGLYPFVVITLAIPFALLVSPPSRRFGRYMLLGMLLTLVVVVGVGALVLWVLMRTDG